ncbi:polyprenyl synthetase family protein [Desulfobacula phenolica]|uniref:Octaprenyl-diphosphate synthase n=1 Tax=Desulfobacula phenolica TaxID=90732 RepID=A0A1H2IZT6_9BACT|nr:polyprenyl synthetase family protein [Desulfobacula phenolica]SDU49660.1 octaprenyl-diphosphate synthase [Desulfobacula phenolica]
MTKGIKQRLVEMVATDLEKIEIELEHHLNPNLELVRQIASHLLFSGGKRLRPLLMIHSARLCGYHDDFEITFSTIFEYLHAATLLHDDVVDEADIRRGKKAAHTKWSAAKVVLTGDFLLARALEIAAKTREPDIISIIAKITRDMSQGEIDQLEKKGKSDLSEHEYLEIIERKTAVLIQGACQSGAILAKAPKEKQEALNQYGFHLGMAFQMADDLLDYTASAKQLGKNPGADMREGKLTLPLIHTLANASPEDKVWIKDAIATTKFDLDQFEKLKQKLVAYKGIEYTENRAQDHVKKAKACLDYFEECPSKEFLCVVADYAIERKV